MRSKTPKFSRKNLTVSVWLQQDVPVEKYVEDVVDIVHRLLREDDRALLSEKIIIQLLDVFDVETQSGLVAARLVKMINDVFGTTYAQANK